MSRKFEPMMRNMSKEQKPENRLQKKTAKRLFQSAEEILGRLSDDPARCQNMAYFYSVLKTVFDGSRGMMHHEDGRKMVGTYCILVPEELIYAADAIPVRLCSSAYDAVELGEDYLPDISCPLVKSSIGLSVAAVLPIYQSCDMVIIPATCDWKVKMGEMLKGIASIYVLDLPRIQHSENARKFWLNEVRSLEKILRQLTGVKITKSRLLKGVRMIQTAQTEFRRFQKIRMSKIPVINGQDALAVMNAYFFDHVETWTKAMRLLNDELEERIRNDKRVCPPSSPRILLTGSPIVFPNWKIPALIEESGGILISDEFCTSNRYIHDMVALDEYLYSDMVHALSERYLQPCTCPIFSETVDRQNRILQLVDDYQVEGVVYHILKGCHPYDMEMKSIEKTMKERGIPQLKIETDLSPEDVEQLRTRIEAFLETVSGRRK